MEMGKPVELRKLTEAQAGHFTRPIMVILMGAYGSHPMEPSTGRFNYSPVAGKPTAFPWLNTSAFEMDRLVTVWCSDGRIHPKFFEGKEKRRR